MKLSQEQVAERLHISQSAYARIEMGKSQSWMHRIEKLCEVFGISFDELFRPESNEEELHQDKINPESQHQSLLSEKLISQYDETIRLLKAQVEMYKSLLDEKSNAEA